MGEFTRQFLKRNETLPLPASSRRSFEAMEGSKVLDKRICVLRTSFSPSLLVGSLSQYSVVVSRGRGWWFRQVCMPRKLALRFVCVLTLCCLCACDELRVEFVISSPCAFLSTSDAQCGSLFNYPFFEDEPL